MVLLTYANWVNYFVQAPIFKAVALQHDKAKTTGSSVYPILGFLYLIVNDV